MLLTKLQVDSLQNVPFVHHFIKYYWLNNNIWTLIWTLVRNKKRLLTWISEKMENIVNQTNLNYPRKKNIRKPSRKFFFATLLFEQVCYAMFVFRSNMLSRFWRVSFGRLYVVLVCTLYVRIVKKEGHFLAHPFPKVIYQGVLSTGRVRYSTT